MILRYIRLFHSYSSATVNSEIWSRGAHDPGRPRTSPNAAAAVSAGSGPERSRGATEGGDETRGRAGARRRAKDRRNFVRDWACRQAAALHPISNALKIVANLNDPDQYQNTCDAHFDQTVAGAVAPSPRFREKRVAGMSRPHEISRPVVFFTLLLIVLPHGMSRAGETPPDGSAAGSNLAALQMGAARGSFRSVLRPAVDVSLSSPAAGIVRIIHVPEGQSVEAGQPIISLDSDNEKAEVAHAEAAVRGSAAEMERATAEFARIQSLRGDNIYSEKQYVDAKTAADLARSRHEQALATLQLANVRLANRTIQSPISGIFLKTNKLVGESVDRYETVVRVVDVRSLEMMVYCDSSHFSLFKTGQQVGIRVLKSGNAQPVVPGLVVHKDPIVDPASGTFRVKIKIERSTDAVAGLPALLIAPSEQQAGNSLQPQP
ncbi:MAG: efflux RND transporter periplasmic adaptor subunit [Opitutus sp.]